MEHNEQPQEEEEVINIITEDGKTFQVLARVAKMMITIKNLLEDAVDTSRGIPITAPSEQFIKVVEYCMHHKDDTQPPPTLDISKVLVPSDDVPTSEWDRDFISGKEIRELEEFMHATNYLNVPTLLDLIMREIAVQVVGMTPDQIYEEFRSIERMTAEQEQEVIRENPYLADQ